MSLLSIITLTRDHPEHVDRLTEALDFQVGGLPNIERILIDNGSRDPTPWALGWRVFRPPSPLSFSAGNNAAAEIASGEWLLLLNDDAIPEPSALAALWEARDQADVLGCLIVHRDGTVNHAGTKLLPWPAHIGRGWPAEEFRGGGVLGAQAVTFAAVLIRRDTYRRLGGLDERYHFGFEDTDFCVRALDAGLRIAVQTSAVMVHEECGTRERHGPLDRENAQLYAQRWARRVDDIVKRARERGL